MHASQAHSLEVVGSNPAPAPNLKPPETSGGFLFSVGYECLRGAVLKMKHQATWGNFVKEVT